MKVWIRKLVSDQFPDVTREDNTLGSEYMASLLLSAYKMALEDSGL